MTAYIGVDGKARKIGSAYIGVDGVARKVKKAYVGVNGVAQLWWAADMGGGSAVLEVEKITSDTYAGSTTYTGEQFILLDIYPKTNGTVSVTYGGLTKTIVDTSGAAEPNAQQVFFGTLNGVSDSAETPASGKLTIEGDYYAFGLGLYKHDKMLSYTCTCVKRVLSFGSVEVIPNSALSSSLKAEGFDGLTGELIIPPTIKRIGTSSFSYCSALTSVVIKPSEITIGSSAFFVTTVAGSTTTWRTVKMMAKTPPTLEAITSDDGTIYYNNFGLKDSETGVFPTAIIVPKGCGIAYKAAEGWSYYADAITEAS